MNYKVLESPRIPIALDSSNTGSNTRKMALIGHLVGGEKVRKYLNHYTLDGLESFLEDLGNISSEHCPNTGTLITDLVEDRSFLPIVIENLRMRESLDDDFIQHFFNPTFISSKAKGKEADQHIGLQSHLIPLDWDINSEKHVRLGRLKTEMSAAEVLLRNADYINIDLNVIRYADNPGPKASTAGLTIEDVCMLAKYAGASTQLKAITISGYNQHQDVQEISARNVALITWYLIDGFRLRCRELENVNSERSFTIIPDDIDGELKFVENQNTGRWWVEVFSDSAEKEVRMACGKEDYEAACQNEISDRLTTILTSI